MNILLSKNYNVRQKFFISSTSREKDLVELTNCLVRCKHELEIPIEIAGMLFKLIRSLINRNLQLFKLSRNFVNLNRILVTSIRFPVCSYFTRYSVDTNKSFFFLCVIFIDLRTEKTSTVAEVILDFKSGRFQSTVQLRDAIRQNKKMRFTFWTWQWISHEYTEGHLKNANGKGASR